MSMCNYPEEPAADSGKAADSAKSPKVVTQVRVSSKVVLRIPVPQDATVRFLMDTAQSRARSMGIAVVDGAILCVESDGSVLWPEDSLSEVLIPTEIPKTLLTLAKLPEKEGADAATEVLKPEPDDSDEHDEDDDDDDGGYFELDDDDDAAVAVVPAVAGGACVDARDRSAVIVEDSVRDEKLVAGVRRRRAGVAGDALAAAAVLQFSETYVAHVLPKEVLNSLIITLRRQKAWSSADQAKFVKEMLAEYFVTSQAAMQIVQAANSASSDFSGKHCTAALVPRVIDAWNLEWDGMDMCTLSCMEVLKMRPATAEEVWALLQSKAYKELAKSGDCCRAKDQFRG